MLQRQKPDEAERGQPAVHLLVAQRWQLQAPAAHGASRGRHHRVQPPTGVGLAQQARVEVLGQLQRRGDPQLVVRGQVEVGLRGDDREPGRRAGRGGRGSAGRSVVVMTTGTVRPVPVGGGVIAEVAAVGAVVAGRGLRRLPKSWSTACTAIRRAMVSRPTATAVAFTGRRSHRAPRTQCRRSRGARHRSGRPPAR